ncbi:MAG: ribosome biogenesis GTPase Der [Victivallaceae bacterium]
MTESMNETEVKIPTVAIVGRPNVGKSSLFNVIIGRRLSIVHEMSGVTRDRVIAPASWNGKHFQLIDTGGLGTMGETRNVDVWDERIAEQVEAAVEGADVLVMVCNIQDGIVSLDQEVAEHLRSCGKKVLMVANKSDNPELENQSIEFSALGFGQVFPVSCTHRRGIEYLMDNVMEAIPQVKLMPVEREPFRIAVIGRPNVGKSSLVNALLGENRVIVSETAGTTRDSIDIDFELEYQKEKLPAKLIDTAGLRKKSKVDNAVEMFSVMRAQEAIERARLVLFMVEASPDGVTAQDRRIASIIEDSGKACVIVANKFDICRDDHKKKELLEELRYSLPGMTYAPVVFVSAKEKYNLDGLLDQVAQVMGLMEVKIPTSLVNRVLSDAFTRCSPPVSGLSPFRMFYAAMVSTEPPKFLIFVNDPKLCAQNYLVYLKNSLRHAFDFTGLPLVISLRARPKKVESIRTFRKKTSPANKPAAVPRKVGQGRISGKAKLAKKARAEKKR